MSRVHTREDPDTNSLIMPYYVYILANLKGRYYVGYTKNITDRLNRHNQGHSKFTKNRGVWKIVYIEDFKNKHDAIRREIYIKSQKSKKFIESLIYRGVEK